MLDAIDQPFVCFTFGLTTDAEASRPSTATSRASSAALGPWDSGRRYLNFAESRIDPGRSSRPRRYDRLLRAKARYDPTGLFPANHPVS